MVAHLQLAGHHFPGGLLGAVYFGEVRVVREKFEAIGSSIQLRIDFHLIAACLSSGVWVGDVKETAGA